MATIGDIETAQRLLQRIAALLGSAKLEVHVHGAPDDVLASMLVAGGNVSPLIDGMHVATLEIGRVALNAYGKRRPQLDPPAQEVIS